MKEKINGREGGENKWKWKREEGVSTNAEMLKSNISRGHQRANVGLYPICLVVDLFVGLSSPLRFLV